MNQARRILRLFYKTEVLLKLKNSKFFADIIDDLEHVIRSRHLKLAERTRDAVMSPVNRTIQIELCLFLDLCSIFRLIVPNSARLTGPFEKSTERPSKTIQPKDEKESSAVASLTGALPTPLHLALPRRKDT